MQTLSNNKPVIYFDGSVIGGWWIGLGVGGVKVWAHNYGSDPMPPTSGWRIPFGKAVDNTALIQPSGPGGQGGAAAEEKKEEVKEEEEEEDMDFDLFG
jgi:hypothetical protein